MRREAVEVGRQGIPDLVLVVALEVPAKQLPEQCVVAVALDGRYFCFKVSMSPGVSSREISSMRKVSHTRKFFRQLRGRLLQVSDLTLQSRHFGLHQRFLDLLVR